MIEPLAPLERQLTELTERLEQSRTQNETIGACRRLIIHLGSRIEDDGNLSNQDKADIERINTRLKDGFLRKPGRPNAGRQAADDARLFHWLRPKTIADGARLLRTTETWARLFGKRQPDDDRELTDSAMRKRAKLAAERGGYVFPAKGKPFGNNGKNAPNLIR